MRRALFVTKLAALSKLYHKSFAALFRLTVQAYSLAARALRKRR